jgi:DNA-binding LacI/PurR family transcriptional regulator
VPVIGFDDTPVAAALGLSSVHQPVERIAERVLALLLKQLARPADAAAPVPDHVLLPSSLVLRQPDPHLLGLRGPGTGYPGS